MNIVESVLGFLFPMRSRAIARTEEVRRALDKAILEVRANAQEKFLDLGKTLGDDLQGIAERDGP